MKPSFVFLLCVLSHFLQAPADAPRPLRVLCIGDSITQGGVRGREEYTYRLPLARTLHERGVPFEMLGTQTEGHHPGFAWPDLAEEVPFPARHEGYYAYTTEQVLVMMRRNISRFPPADVAFIHLGTNDQRSRNPREAVIRPLEEIISLLRDRNEHVIILVGHILFDEAPARRIRALKNEMADRLHRPEAPVLTVPHYQNWVANPRAPNTHTFDWLHPNPPGQEKMARAWLQTLDRAMEIQKETFEPESEARKRIQGYLDKRRETE